MIHFSNGSCNIKSCKFENQDEERILDLKVSFSRLLASYATIKKDEVQQVCSDAQEFLNNRIGAYENQEMFGSRFFVEFYPFFSRSHLLRLGYAKLYGYAGDFKTIHTMYENNPRGGV